VPLAGILEEWPAQPGRMRILVPPAADARLVRVEGAAHCAALLDNGRRVESCAPRLPVAAGARLVVDHDTRPLRVTTLSPDIDLSDAYGLPLPSGTPSLVLPPATAMLLSGVGTVDRRVDVVAESAFHLRAGSGVCALLSGSEWLAVDGFAAGCAIDRVLAPGHYRVVVRPFGRRAMTGELVYTTEPVETLGEGIGNGSRVAAGEARFFRFSAASAGRVGLGLQVPAERLDCALLDAKQRVLGEGCQQYVRLEAGSYLLRVSAPAGVAPTSFRPVLFGLAGSHMEVPEEYLRDFFERIGIQQSGGEP